LVGHTGSVASLATNACGTLLVSGSYDTTLRVWELKPAASQPSVATAPQEIAPTPAVR
jgi:WD40 repeat protein